MKSGREMTPPPGFSTLTPIPSSNELPPITISTFTATTPENTPLNNRASTSANLDPMITSSFIEANYENLESLLRERQKQIHNEDLRTKLEYFSEDYDEEREMEPKPVRIIETTPPLQLSLTSVHGGPRPSINTGGNLPPNGTHLSYNAQPFIPSNLQPPNKLMPTHVNLYSQPHTGVTLEKSLNYPPRAQNGNPSFGGTFIQYSQGGYVPQALASSNIHTYNGFIYPAIEDYPLPDGLKMPSHVGSYDEKGDPDNFLHLLEGTIRMQKWAMPVAYHMFTYTLKDSARIWWNSQKSGSILNYEDLKANSGHTLANKRSLQRYTSRCTTLCREKAKELEPSSPVLPTIYKGLIEKTYTWIEAREVATNGAPNNRREVFDRSKKNPSWDNNKGQKIRDKFSPYHGSNHGLLSNLSKSPREILATKKVAKTFEQPPRLLGSRRS
ncbi:hypothetical protein Tco_0513886 [Tanacetum coccineum]